MNRLTFELVAASTSRNPRRFFTQAALTTVVVLAACGALGVARSGTDSLAETVNDSGALEYKLSAVNPATGSAESFDGAALELLSSADNVEYVSAVADIRAGVIDSEGNPPTSEVGVVAVNDQFLDNTDWVLTSGVRPFAPQAVDAARQATLGETAAAKFGVTPQCVATQACWVTIGGIDFRVASVARFTDDSLNNVVVVQLAAAIDEGLTNGPTLVTVQAIGLPTSKVALSLDHIASSTGRTVFVEAPDAAGELRTGVAATWAATLTASAVVLMGLGSVAQLAMQLTAIRFRQSEIATLRSLGCSPGAVTAQFALEPAVVSAIGAGAGLILSLSVARVLQRLGLDASLPLDGAAIISIAAVIATTAASYLAALRVANIAPSAVLGS